MKVALIFTAYKNPDLVKRVVQQLLKSTVTPDEVIIAEDGRDMQFKGLLNGREQNRTQLIHVQQADKGFRRSKILNKAVHSSSADYIIVSDSDCLLHPRFIQDHLKFAKKNQFILGARSYVKEEIIKEFEMGFFYRLRQSFIGNIYPKKVAFRLPWLCWCSNTAILGANMSFWKKDYELVNGFSEEFESWGHEDMEFIQRLENAGRKRLWRYQQCIMFHLNHPSREDSYYQRNIALYDDCVAKKLEWCERGLDQYQDQPKDAFVKEQFPL